MMCASVSAFHRWVFTLLILFSVGGSGRAAELPFVPLSSARPPGFVVRNWGTKDGLPQNTVTAALQARDGYLWLGTLAGLARFDGMRFKVFGLAEGLPNVQVNTLFEDAAGDLWIGTMGGGVSRMRNGQIESIRAAGISDDENVTALAADARGRLWIGTSEGLMFWEDGKLFRDESFGQVGKGLIRALLKGRDGEMWISSVGGVYVFRDGVLSPVTGPAPDTVFSPYCLLEDRAGNLWASIGNGKVLCRRNGVWQRYDETAGVPFAYVTCLAEDAKGTVWAGSLDAGLYYFDAGRFNRLPPRDGLSSPAIRSLLPDREGNLWVGHRSSGFDRLTAQKLVTLGAERGLTNDYVRSVAEMPDGRLWLGTTGGGIYREDAGALRWFTNAPFNAAYPFVQVVLPVRDGSLWWGGAGSLFHWVNDRLAEGYLGGTTIVITNAHPVDWLANVSVTALREDIKEGLWVGTSRGKVLHLLNGQARELTNRLGRGSITSFAQEPDGTLWIGSLAGGLSRMQGDNVTTFSETNGLASTHVRVLHRSADGTLWIGTGGGGLVWLKDKRFHSVSARQGLGDDTVSQILEDDEGCLWLGCNRGIFRVRRSELNDIAAGKSAFVHPQAFGLNAGMLAEECTGGSSPAAYKLRSGKLAFATVRGVALIDPQPQVFEATVPAVMVEEVRANREPQKVEHPVAQGEAETLPTVTIKPGLRECEFHYTGLNFAAPERVRFRYQLIGLDADWVEADTRRVAYYNPLRHGQYIFRVSACTATGVWSEHEARLAVIVLPHFWETGWFMVLLWLAGIGALATLVYRIARQPYKRRLAALEMQHAIERERLRISQDMHDQIGSILTRVSVLSDVAQSEHAEPELQNQFEQIGTNVRTAVQGLDEIVWATNPKSDNLPQFADYIGRFADEFFESTGIRCWHELPNQLPNLPLRSEMRHNIFLAVKEALNNVLKHSQAKEVWLRLKLDEGRVTIEVQDNGHGFEPKHARQGGNGLGNMESRLAAVGGRAILISSPGYGTRIRLIFTVAEPG